MSTVDEWNAETERLVKLAVGAAYSRVRTQIKKEQAVKGFFPPISAKHGPYKQRFKDATEEAARITRHVRTVKLEEFQKDTGWLHKRTG